MSWFQELGDDVVKFCIFGLLHSYELKKLLIISKWFNNLLSSSGFNNINDKQYWKENLMRYYGNYGIWRRGWIDLSKGIFEKLSNDDANQLKYFLLRYDDPNQQNNDKELTIPTDINSLYLYNYSSSLEQVDRKIMFTSTIIK
mmetsp:Transcript_68681/g.61703  ORF Transcript_68681/g.61703 Transcript_68681/m.61703 type:complete len:143 (+) Transcript_68681:89-517(+)